MADTDLADLRRPVLGRIVVAAASQGLSVAPMVAVVEIGRRLLAGEREQLRPIAFVAIGPTPGRAPTRSGVANLEPDGVAEQQHRDALRVEFQIEDE